MLQSSFFDPVLGLDIHIVLVPTPAGPVPTPVPMPFVGMVFDPVGLAIGAAIGMATGGGPGLVLVNSLPVTNCGTSVTNKLTMPHLPVPGVAFAKGLPGNDAELFFGSLNVSLGGTLGVRLGDIALSCSDPVRLPTSVVLAIPKGMPVLNMPAMVPDFAGIAQSLLMAGAMRLLRAAARGGARLFRALRAAQRRSSGWARVSRALRSVTDRIAPQRYRDRLRRAICFVTGHPVDVATGRVFTDNIDFKLPGPLPLVFERVYSSSLSWRNGVLGHGWSHPLNQKVWLEPGKVVLLAEDGREIEFDTTSLPEHVIQPGQSLYHPLERLTLRAQGQFRWQIEAHDGVTQEFSPVAGGDPTQALLQVRRMRDGHAIKLTYDDQGRLKWCRDSVGRLIGFEHDAQGRLTSVKLPVSKGEGWYVHTRYVYSPQGDLVEVIDADGKAQTFEYVGHLLVRETDRTGLSFYFQWDGHGSNARCVRTWGDGGIFDHVITYDIANRRTLVENSHGDVTAYTLDELGMVVAEMDPQGGIKRYEWDPACGQQASVTDPIGRTTKRLYDSRGNCTEVIRPDKSSVKMEYDAHNLPVRVETPGSVVWQFAYDGRGRLTCRMDPLGGATRFEYDEGQLRRILRPGGTETLLTYDEHENLTSVRTSPSGEIRTWFDFLGRPLKQRDAAGMVLKWRYDALGRVAQIEDPAGFQREYGYDAKGNVVQIRDAEQHIQLSYEGNHWLAGIEERGNRIQLKHDTEGRLVRVTNPAGETYRYELDPVGRVSLATSFDGRTSRYEYDPAGRVVAVQRHSGKRTEYAYDDLDQMTEVYYADGRSEQYKYDAAGAMVEAANDDVALSFERDLLGRVVRELCGEDWVASTYGLYGGRAQYSSSEGARARLRHDALGQLEAMTVETDGCTWSAQFKRGPDGQELERMLPGGIHSQSEWAPHRLPLRRAHLRGRRVIAERRYEWSPGGRLQAITDSERGVLQVERAANGSLIGARLPGGRYQTRVPDAAGNVFRQTDRRDRTYGPGGRLLEADGISYRYDEDGQLIEARRGDEVTRYVWNGAGMLDKVLLPNGDRVSFTYDPMGRRTRKTVYRGDELIASTSWVWDGAVPIHERRSGEAPITWMFEPSGMIPLARLQGERRWSVLTDHLGTPTELLDEDGGLAWRMQMDLYGAATVEELQTDCPFRWPGQYEDRETGLHYNRFRYYAPQSGRFLSADPLGVAGGLGAYNYVEDPLTRIDPLGLTSCTAQDLKDLPPNTAVVRVSDQHVAIYIVDSQGNRTWSSLGVTSQGSGRRFRSEQEYNTFIRDATPQDLQNAQLRTRIFSGSDGMGDRPVQDYIITSETAGRSLDFDAMMNHHRSVTGGGGGQYNVHSNNCVTHVRNVLGAGGLQTAPGPSPGNLQFFGNNPPGAPYDGNFWTTVYGG
ncbi:MAG TPA: DUF6531 domain-containing protein [Myxococcaceae bacterium]|jgi:RHS repeat-associated protein